jgi:hypothetical protein
MSAEIPGNLPQLKRGLSERIVDGVCAAAVASGILLAMVWAGFGFAHASLDPLPAFASTEYPFKPFYWRIFYSFAALWLVWIASMWRRWPRWRRDGLILPYLGSVLAFGMGLGGWALGAPVINALLDSSPTIATPIIVNDVFHRYSSSTRFGAASTTHASVHRRDDPSKRAVINWQGCRVPDAIPVSPFAVLQLSRGALGVPWFKFSIDCRPLRVDDQPLFKGRYLGRGKPLVMFTIAGFPPKKPEDPNDYDGYHNTQQRLLTALSRLAKDGTVPAVRDAESAVLDCRGIFDEDKDALHQRVSALYQEPSKEKVRAAGRAALDYAEDAVLALDRPALAARWARTLAEAAPGTEMVFIQTGDFHNPAFEHLCASCRSLQEADVNDEILNLFISKVPGSHVDWREGERVFLADGDGRRAFAAPMSKIARAPELVALLKAERAPLPAGRLAP